jgi:hypothetical protein
VEYVAVEPEVQQSGLLAAKVELTPWRGRRKLAKLHEEAEIEEREEHVEKVSIAWQAGRGGVWGSVLISLDLVTVGQLLALDEAELVLRRVVVCYAGPSRFIPQVRCLAQGFSVYDPQS